METSNHLFPWLELIDRPTFCTRDGLVLAVNSAAEKYTIRTGMDVNEIVGTNREVYDTLRDGSLYLTITVENLPYNACVTRTKEFDIFTITQTEEDAQLQALALAAQQLRIPLANMMTVADTLFENMNPEDSESQQQIGQINRNLYRMLRIVSNMSDANSYQNAIAEEKQSVNFTTLFDETVKKIQAISDATEKKLVYTGLDSPVFGLANEEKLGRAIYNLVSNALKFSPAGSTVETSLKRNRNSLSFTVANTNPEPLENVAFQNRYTRKPSIEENRFGLGLGMTLIAAVACSHGGTVLVDHPTADITRVTMTIAIVEDTTGVIHSPVLRIGDYAGGRDKGLLELSEILPVDAYKDIN